MAPVYEFEGKTREEAARNACEALGISEDELDIEVISYGSTGIFGLVGVKKAKIKVTVPEPPEGEIKKSTPSPTLSPAEHEEVAEMAKSTLEKIMTSTTTRQIGRTVARELTRGLLGVMGISSSTRRRRR